jgi:hypothetical protein
MFLSSAGRLVSRERGSALIAVLGIALVMMIASLMIATMSISALGFTSTTRAGIQAKTAAESGINVAVVTLRSGACDATKTQTTAPAYAYQVSFSRATTGDSWVLNCPPVADQTVKRIKIVSTGTANAQTGTGVSSANKTSVEAVFPFTPAILPGVKASGAAMFFYGGVVFDNNGNLLVSAGGPPAIQVADGDVSCANNTVIKGDVVVALGSLSISSCTIQGNAWVQGTATLGTVTGNLSASNATRPSGVAGSYTTNGTVPAVPAWVPFGYNPADWIDSSGNPYKVITMTAACSLSPAMMTAAAATGTAPVIINAMACASGLTASGSLSLPNDLVVFAPEFDLSNSNNLTIKSSDTTEPRRLWFITPDITRTSPPTCDYSRQGDFTIKNGFAIDDTVSAMLYTPCQFNAKNTFTWNGQMYANGSTNSFKNNTAFTYVGLGLPGVDLSLGTTLPGGSAGMPSTLKPVSSMRDVKLGG